MSASSDSPPGAEIKLALSLARAAVAALRQVSPEVASRIRAELRKEAIGLDLKPSDSDRSAAAAIRRMLDDDR